MPNKPNDGPNKTGAAAESDRPGETLEPLRHPSAADAGELHHDEHDGAYTHQSIIAGQTRAGRIHRAPRAHTRRRSRDQ